MFKKYLAVAAISLLIAAGCSSDSSDIDGSETSESAESTVSAETETVAPDTAAYDAFRAKPVACGGTAPEPPSGKQYDAAEDQGIDPDQAVTATIRTSCGALVLELDPAVAPNTVNNFVFLASEGFYDGIVSHRIVPSFVLQIGDPTATGAGGPGYQFADELPEATSEYTQGAVVMANAGPNTNGSQIFVNLVDNTDNLQLLYSKFGQLTAGQDVLDKIAAIPTSGPNGDTPEEALYIESVTIEIS